jgi:hypothetical protein
LRQLAVVTEYGQLVAALRARAEELNVSNLLLDEIGGTQTGYCSKILIGIKTLGRISLGCILGALAIKLIVVEDTEQLDRIRSRLVARKAGTRRRADAAGETPISATS